MRRDSKNKEAQVRTTKHRMRHLSNKMLDDLGSMPAEFNEQTAMALSQT